MSNKNSSSAVTSLGTGMGVQVKGKVMTNSNAALNVVHHVLSHAIQRQQQIDQLLRDAQMPGPRLPA